MFVKASIVLSHGSQTLIPHRSSGKISWSVLTWSQCYKNTIVNYGGNFNPTFSRVKTPRYIVATLG